MESRLEDLRDYVQPFKPLATVLDLWRQKNDEIILLMSQDSSKTFL